MFRKLLDLDEAKNKILECFSPKPHGIEEIPLLKTVGRVFAEDIVSPINVPPFNRSTVDGYAVKAEDTFCAQEDNPVTFELISCADVGEISKFCVEKNSTIMSVTGAPLPLGADAVVMIENTTEKDKKILIYKAVVKGENVMAVGSDIRKGEVVVRRGRVASSREIGVLAALGISKVKMFRPPKIAIISTGAEIVPPGKPLPPGKIYDINTYTLTTAILESGGQPLGFGIIRDDDVERLEITLKKALGIADLVVTSGGVSVGPKDVLPKVLDDLGKPGLVIHGVAVKPGKPVAVAVVDKKPVFALPGNPTSSLLMFHLLVRPILLKMVGKMEESVDTVKAIITDKVFSARGRRTFVAVTLSRDCENRLLASPVPTGQSGAITTLAKADGYMELKETRQFVEAGEEVTVFLFKSV